MESGMTAEHDVRPFVRRFEEAENSGSDAREASERDRDYYDGKQLTDTEIKALKKRGQPPVVFNRIQRKVNYLKGLEAQMRKDPKAFPREPGDDGSAQAATDALRYVCDDQDWDAKRSDAFENIIVEGTAAVFVGLAQARDAIDPAIVQIPWDRFYFDPYSRRVDFSDASYMGIVTWMDMDEAKRKFPGRDDYIDATWSQAQASQTYDDRPKWNIWADYGRKRVRVNEEYYLEGGQWTYCVYTQSGFLVDPQASPYLDVDGQPECPIKATSAYVDRDNNRYGEVRAMISPQDEVNKRRSKGLHLINSRQTRISRSSGMSASEVKRELAKPDGVIFGEQGDIEVLQTGDMAAANFQMLQEAKAEIDLLGPNAALAGKNENDASGRALLAQQQGGMIEVALLMDRLRQLSLAVYRTVWARIKQAWKGPRWLRVTADDRNLRFVGLNTPRSMLDVAKERLGDDPQAEQKLALLASDPMAQMPVDIQNNVAEMDIDIVIDEGMDTPTVQAEQFDMLTKMLPSMAQLPPDAVELLITASSLRDKDKLLAVVEKMKQQAAQPDPAQQAAQQLQMADAQAEIEKKRSEAVENIASAEAKRAGIVTDMVGTQQQATEPLGY
ncbi:hypothetical protein TomTYG75_07110 [Sphingobium sp. TomTYG75]